MTEAKSIEKPAVNVVSIANPFAKAHDERANAGVVAIESEAATAREQGKLVVAKRFPRDPFKSFEKIREACKRKGLAEEAFYKYQRGGSDVTGPSIRLAEELARCWGNIEYGIRELSNDNGRTEMEAYAFDLEANVTSKQQFVVHHIRDTRGGGQKLTDQRDIYEIAANMGARRLRSRILALLPADFVDGAVQVARATLAAADAEEPMAERVKKLLNAFSPFGVMSAHIEAKLGHSLETITPGEFQTLREIHSSLRDGGKMETYFAPPVATAPATASSLAPATSSTPASATAPAAAKPETKAATPPKRRMNIQDVPAPAPAATPATETKPEPTMEREPGADDDKLFG